MVVVRVVARPGGWHPPAPQCRLRLLLIAPAISLVFEERHQRLALRAQQRGSALEPLPLRRGVRRRVWRQSENCTGLHPAPFDPVEHCQEIGRKVITKTARGEERKAVVVILHHVGLDRRPVLPPEVLRHLVALLAVVRGDVIVGGPLDTCERIRDAPPQFLPPQPVGIVRLAHSLFLGAHQLHLYFGSASLSLQS